jgi:hypothetical protein
VVIQQCRSHSAPSCSRATRMLNVSFGKQYSYIDLHVFMILYLLLL